MSEQSSIQCLLHWRFTLNDNGIIRGNGTWGAEEDERLRKLAPVFSSPATGPRYVVPLKFNFTPSLVPSSDGCTFNVACCK